MCPGELTPGPIDAQMERTWYAAMVFGSLMLWCVIALMVFWRPS